MNQPIVRVPRPKLNLMVRNALYMVLGVVLLFGFLLLLGRAIPSTHPLVACAVEADPTVVGKAYVQFEYQLSYGPCSDAQSVKSGFVYETDDYGQTWHYTSNPPGWDAWYTQHNVPGLSAYDNQLWFNGRSIRSIPHQLSQIFAYPNDSMGSPNGLISSAAPPGQGVLYVAMGEYGLLIGPNPAENANLPWYWLQGEVPGYFTKPVELSSLPVTHPAEVEALIICAMTLPLVFLSHTWLLGQAWRYMYPPDETYAVMSLCRWVALIVSAVYVLVLELWHFDASANFFVLDGIFAVCVVTVSVLTGVSVARRRQFTDAFVRKLGIVTGLLSLIVPAVVAATPTQVSWPLLVALLLGFIVYRRALRRYLDRFEARATLWQIDRLTLEIEGLFVLLLVPMGLLSAVIFQNVGALFLIALIAVPSIAAAVMWGYTKWRGHGFVLKKKASPLELHDTPLFGESQWFAMLLGRTVVWLLGAAGIWLVLALPHLLVQVNILLVSLFAHDI